MRTIILAAGRGSELSDSIAEIPKCMLSIGNETILDRQVRILYECGIRPESIYVVIGYKASLVKSKYQCQMIYNANFNFTDNSYSLYLALQDNDEDILLLDGDLVFDKCMISELLNAKRNSLAVTRGEQYGSTGVRIIADTSIITDIGKHISDNITYESALYLDAETSRAWFALLDQEKNFQTWYSITLDRLVKSCNVYALFTEARIKDVNTYFDYLEAKRIFAGEDFLIMVTGASGLLGGKVYSVLSRTYRVLGLQCHAGRENLVSVDLTDKKKVEAILELHQPKIIIHTAGIAEPEKCALNPDASWQLNVNAVSVLVNACKKNKTKLIHISTDYVFDGESNEAYTYEAHRKPKNLYGEQKKEAEDIVMSYTNSLVIRVPILYGYNSTKDKETFPVRVLRALCEHKNIFLDNTQMRYPVLIDEVALAIQSSLPKRGIVHMSSPIACTKYEWGKIIADQFHLDSSLIKEDKTHDAKDRPRHVRLDIANQDYMLSDIRNGTEILRKQMNCVFQLIYKSNPVSAVMGKRIASYRYKLGYSLGEQIPESIVAQLDCVMPVPSSGLYYAMGLAEYLHVPYVEGLVKADLRQRSFQLADISLRKKMIRSKILPIAELIFGKVIALVDEAIFTGITLKVVCDMLKACNAKKIYICIPTPVCNYRCEQYVQPNRKLLSETVNPSALKGYFGIQDVFFQPYRIFEKSVCDVQNVCFECFAPNK